MTEMFFWIGACGLAMAVGAPLVYLVLFNPPLGKKILLVAASVASALILALHIKPDLADRLILGTLQVDQMVETARPVRHLDFDQLKIRRKSRHRAGVTGELSNGVNLAGYTIGVGGHKSRLKELDQIDKRYRQFAIPVNPI